MSVNNKQTEEEVDLGSLFVVIGNGFRKLFNFIWKVLTGLFHFLILILLFLKENSIKLAIAAVIGGGIHYYVRGKLRALYYVTCKIRSMK